MTATAARMLAAVALLTTACPGGAGAADWPLFGHDAARSAVSGDAGRGRALQLRARWRIDLGDVADSAPIAVGDRVYLTTRNGTTYALDSATGSVVWRFATHGPNITTSVPAFDAPAGVLYAPGVDGAVHKLDPADGSEFYGAGFPAPVTLSPDTEKHASPLNVANGYLYAQTGGYMSDAPPYAGHVVAIRLRDGAVRVFNALCSGRDALVDPRSCAAQRAGMWSRAGVVVDPDPAMHGRIYAASGNGPFSARSGDYGDSIFALSADGSRLIGAFTPSNVADLEASDLDVGSSSPALLPRQPDSSTPLLAVQGGKDGVLRLLDRAHLSAPNAALQLLSLGARLLSAPAVWRDGQGVTFVFVGLPDGLHAYRLRTHHHSSRLEAAWRTELPGRNEATSPIVSGDLIVAATTGRLTILDAETGRELRSSDALGPIHWESPSAADGLIYCSDETGALTAFDFGPRQ